MPFFNTIRHQADRTNGRPSSSLIKGSRNFLSDLLTPLSVRDFRLLFSGQLISNLGDMFYLVALPWFMLSNGGGAQALGVVLVAYGIPRAVSPLLGGIVSDRLGPRWIMLLADSMRALLVGVLAWMALEQHPALWLLCLIMILLGTGAGLFLPASFSIMPAILPESGLQAANALSSTSTQLAVLIGPALAGLVISHFQPSAALALDALTFIISAITLAWVRSSSTPLQQVEHGARQDTHTSEYTNADRTPLTFRQLLRNSRLLQITLVLIVVANFFGGGIGGVALPAFAHDVLKAGVNGYGVILAAFGLGALIGSIGANGLGRLPRRGLLVLLIWLAQGIAITLIPFAGFLFGVAGSAVCSAIEGLMNSLGNITFRTIMQQHFPRHLLGRINGAFLFCEFSLYPLSVAFASIIVVRWGVVVVFLINGTLCLIAVAFGLYHRELREV